MKNLMNHDVVITDIRHALFVKRAEASLVHKCRASHGLALNLSSFDKTYIFSDGLSLTLKQNEIIFLPKGSSYTVKTESSGDCYAINFDVADDVDATPFVFKIKNYNGVKERFEKAATAFKRKHGAYQLTCRAILYEIIAIMQDQYRADYVCSDVSSMIDSALEYIHRHYTDVDISIGYLAQMCGISEDYFRKIFKLTHGVSPIKYINTLKVTYAKELLSSGMYSVTEAAELSGFADASYFSREFKTHTGVCPSQYVKLS